MYYNDKQKLRYLENSRLKQTTLEVARVLFNRSSRVEAQKSLDLSQFNRPQVVDLL